MARYWRWLVTYLSGVAAGEIAQGVHGVALTWMVLPMVIAVAAWLEY